MSPACAQPITLDDLLAYRLGERDEAAAEEVEAHWFGCAHCSGRLEVIDQLVDGVRAVVHAGHFMGSGTMAIVERARARGIAVREYRTDPDEHVYCTAGPDDVLTVTRYGGLVGAASVDVHFRGVVEGTDEVIALELQDAPIDHQTGDLVLIAPGELNRSFPALEIEVRLTVRDAGGSAREAGPYHYHHRPWALLDDEERARRAGR